jgi:hypothetical protein
MVIAIEDNVRVEHLARGVEVSPAPQLVHAPYDLNVFPRHLQPVSRGLRT